MIDEMKCCANCEYWYLYDEEKFNGAGFGEGECRRYPPSVPNIECDNNKNSPRLADLYIPLIRGTMLMSNPFTFAEEWCGEFKLMKTLRWTEEDEE